MSAANIKFSLEVDDKGSVKVKRFGKTVDKTGIKGAAFGRKMKAAGVGVASLGSNAITAAGKLAKLGVAVAAVAVGVVLKESLQKFAEYEVALNRIGNVSSESLGAVAEKIKAIDPEIGNYTELMKGYYAVMSAGVTGADESMDLLVTASKAARESGVAQAEVVKGLAAVMGAYSKELKTSSDAADLLYTIEKSGITSVQELIPLIGNLGNLAAATGLTVNEMGAALAQVSTSGAGTSVAVTQLQSLMTALSKKFSGLPETVKKYGSAIDAVKALGFQGVLKEIMEATKGNSTELIDMLGRQEAYLALLQLSKGEFKDYGGRLDEMKEKVGAFKDAWDRYKVTLTATWETFKNTVGNQAILIGEQLAPKIKEVLELAGEWLKTMKPAIIDAFSTAIARLKANWGEIIAVIKTAWGFMTKIANFVHMVGAGLGIAAAKGVEGAAKVVAGVERDVFNQGQYPLAKISEINPVGDLPSSIANELGGIPERFTTEFVVEGKVKASPEMPFTEGMDYLESRIQNFASTITGLTPGMTVQINTAVAEQELSDFQQRMVNFERGILDQRRKLASVTEQVGLASPFTRLARMELEDAIRQRNVAVGIEGMVHKQGGGVNLTFAPQFMTGDANAARNVAVDIKRELDNIGVRWGE